uniref:Uncharacterized protein KLLA0E17732g n=1 Tax=Kluyveromyces lactis (strain ATCC 8585 / CBS 2359 / DSM 70799 / NBRC 1267 / NRRL Y-1140 / WM37) TaxID=284590 RepID=YIPP_KLULA|nr:RecName: Full=Uncharacterized protein KLLA0E17732g [Kluyveromyces lactis NRRL Y-1140]CAA32447.1 unnamed protein product [Kluyveromyces lactis]
MIKPNDFKKNTLCNCNCIQSDQIYTDPNVYPSTPTHEHRISHFLNYRFFKHQSASFPSCRSLKVDDLRKKKLQNSYINRNEKCLHWFTIGH